MLFRAEALFLGQAKNLVQRLGKKQIGVLFKKSIQREQVNSFCLQRAHNLTKTTLRSFLFKFSKPPEMLLSTQSFPEGCFLVLVSLKQPSSAFWTA